MERTIEKNKQLSSHLLIACFLLCSMGILASYSSSALKSSDLFGTPYHFLFKQTFGVLIGFSLVLIIQKLPIAFFDRIALPFFCATSFLLLLVFVPGFYHRSGGATRWLHLGIIGIQPAELAKLSLVFLLAKNLSRKSFSIKKFSSVYFVHILLLGFLSLCLMKQPDFGSTFFVFLITFLMLFVAGLPLKHIFLSGLALIPIGAWAIISEPYRMKRLLSFLNPWENINQGGFQIIQSYLAFNNGGLLGVGFGNSKQKLFYLPEAHTDFILSVLAEELGFIGVLFILALFLYVIYLGTLITQQCKDPYRKFLAFGLTLLLALQIIVNIAVVLGLLPTKGSSLPFLSSGVSSLLSCLIAVGVLARLALEKDSSSTCYSEKKTSSTS